uniref:C-type lectin domain-containing protein n=1 Tax=Meloidogyne enterolobii TaxID=390850 RepID=A0A6V7VNR9_MELEN|nr:unnamed protein product [Meloidogyne enterolobii]
MGMSPILFSLIFGLIPTLVSTDCSVGNWTTRVDSDGNTYGYQVLMRDWLNFYEARALCLGVGGDVVSVHSNAENEFVRQLAAPYIAACQTNKTVCGSRATTSLDFYLSVVWIGMTRCQYFPSYNSTVDCVYSDGTTCNYATSSSVYPWGVGSPSGSDSGGGAGLIEDCVSMYNGTSGEWNDVSCFQKLGGVVCKRNCTGTCGSTSIKTALLTSPSDITDTSCPSGNWTKRAGEDGNTYGYQVVMKDWLNFYEANAKCLALGAEVVSIHTVAENEFIRQLAAPYITACQTNTSVCVSRVSTTQDTQWRSLWLGLHRCAFYPTYNATVDCINSDGTVCDYLNITGGPSGTETGTASGQQEACAAMYSATTGQWNDIACFNKLGGVICKKNCSKACGVASTTTTQLTTTTTQLSTTTTAEPTTTTTLTTTTTTLPTTTTTLPTTTTTEPSTTTTLPTTTTTEPSTTTTAEPTTTTTEPSTTTSFNCAQPPVTSLLSYNTSDPNIQTGPNATGGVCECPADPGNNNVFFIPVTTITTGSSASNSSVIMKCSKMQDFCICDEDDICWKVINAYSLVVINSFCDPTCHMYARLQNAAPFNQTFESDCGRTITLADELTPIPNTNRNTFKPLGSSADYYIKAASIRCLQAGQTCTPIKCSGTRKPSPCPTTTTTMPTTTTTLPTTTTTLPTTTTTLPPTTTTLPTTTTTLPTTTTTLPTTTTTLPTTTTTLPTTTTTLPTTTTTLPTTTTTLPTTTTTLPTTTTTLPTTTTTLPTTTTTLPTTTTTLPTTTTTLPTTTTTLPTTTTTLPTTTTTLPTTTTTLPTTTTTLPSTTTVLPTTTTPPINCADCSAGQSKVIYEKNTLLSNQTINNLAATECIYNCKDKDVSQACYNPSPISVVRIRCTDSTKFCVCTSDNKGCFTVTQSAPLYQADYLIYANASYTFLALNTGASQ